MVNIEYLGNAGDGFMVHIDGRAPRFIEPHAFLCTFGVSTFHTHVLDDAEVTEVTEETVTCSPDRFPQVTVEIPRTSEGDLLVESGLVLWDGQPLTTLVDDHDCYTMAYNAISE